MVEALSWFAVASASEVLDSFIFVLFFSSNDPKHTVSVVKTNLDRKIENASTCSSLRMYNISFPSCCVHPRNMSENIHDNDIVYFPQIYFATEEYGLDSTVTSGGYFLMADVFAKQGKSPIVHSLYLEVCQLCCYCCLCG